MTTEATQDAPTLPDHRPAVAGQVERSVMPHAWWRASVLPECRPCVTTDPDEAQQWLREGHHVRVLTERQKTPCTHERRWVYKHYTYGNAWACLACGEHGESWWD